MAIQSSGNLIADRRFDYARGYLDDGDAAAAVDLLEQTLELVPEFAPAWHELGLALARTGRVQEARDAFARALFLEPDDRLGAALQIARLDGLVPPQPPRAYVRGLFDDYADRFEQALVDDLGYRTPQHLFALLMRAGVTPPGPALDLGCGTGLMAEALGDGWVIDGVDLSSAMLEKARAKAIYRRLECADLMDGMSALGGSYTLILAADVFVYLGDLSPVLIEAANRLEPGGLMAFSTEAATDVVTLQESLRFAHDPATVVAALERAGLSLLDRQRRELRRDRSAAIMGDLYVCRKCSA